jgi:hypothetical protein
MKMHEQLAAGALRKAQPARVTSEKATKRQLKKLSDNLDRPYVFISRQLQRGVDGVLDFQHTEIPVPGTSLKQRVYPKGRSYRHGSNALKRSDRRAHVKARVAERKAVGRG